MENTVLVVTVAGRIEEAGGEEDASEADCGRREQPSKTSLTTDKLQLLVG